MFKLEYIWIDGTEPTSQVRSKTKVVEEFDRSITSCPDWGFDGSLDITDVILLVNFVLGQTPTEEEALTADFNQDGIINILDVITLVGEILGTNFAQSVQWLEENFPSLKTKERLSKLNKSQYFSK